MKKIFILLPIFLFTISFPQQLFKPHPFSKTMVIGFEGGATYSATDYSTQVFDYAGKFFIEYFLRSESKSSFGIRALFNTGFITGESKSLTNKKFRTQFYSTGLGLIYLLSASDIFYPYISVGVCHLWFQPRGEDGSSLTNYKNKVYTPKEINFNSELGFRLMLADNLSMILNGGVQISPNDYLDDLRRGTSNDLFFAANLGLSYSLFTEADSDKDGIPDSKDKCANTPLGVKVDDFGCPFDSDNDGIPDYLDKCPNTPRNVSVDADGCPFDTDGDGVPDYRDLCPDTPKRIKVDDFGCPFDSDNDGIPDYLDKCPNTPLGVDVDAKGCPVDSDLDGIPDYLDKCPDSAPGEIVDEKGCKKIIELPKIETDTVKVEPIREVSLRVSDIFEKNGITLKQSAFVELDKILEEMKREPLSRWRIESYTDNIGSAEANLRTSQKRAEIIQNHFLSKGISKIRVEAVGFGNKSPIADNKTEEGRDKNRRIIIRRIN
ncbi:MAG: thrombospondin type 3 repeat-containing protein [Ignavibacterium sp.]|nr:thrombospondin type 3 repeat-containing protein [Ignavibacterium sp.]MDW8375344.1 thrombospondin type 3 repeat-containing protein [Ignavibacteriales bacterium]